MIFLGLSLLVLVLAAHPFVTYPLSLIVLRRIAPDAPPAPPTCEQPSVSILVCAYNEAAVIAHKAANLVALRRAYGNLQILVYVDGSSDDTAERLKPFAAEMSVIVSPQRRGKNFGLRTLSMMATGSILVLTDANVVFTPDALTELVRGFADPRVGCVCGAFIYHSPERTATSAINNHYWQLEDRICELESNFSSVMTASGGLFAVRRCLYPELPDHVADDLYVSMTVLCSAHRVIFAGSARGHEITAVARDEEFRRKVRVAAKAFSTHCTLWKYIRHLSALQFYCYFSHKLLRWFTAASLAIAALLFTAGLATEVGTMTTAGLTGGAMIAAVVTYRSGMKSVTKAYEIWLAFVATFLGVLTAMQGTRFVIWTPSQASRMAVFTSPAEDPPRV